MAQLKLNVTTSVKQAQADLKGLESSVNKIITSLQKIPVNKDLTKQMNAYAKAVNATTKELKNEILQEKLRTQQAKTSTEAAKQLKLAEDSRLKGIKDYNETLRKTWADDNKHRENMEKIASKTKEVTQHTEKKTRALKADVKETKEATKQTEMYSRSIFELASSFLEYQIAATLIMKPIYKLREAFESVNETLQKTEDAVIEIKRVISEDLSSKTISDDLFDIAIKYAQDVENVWEIAQNFAKSGMSWADTLKATEAAVLALNVAELDATEASNGLIAVLAQFHLQASDLTEVIDILNKEADNAPVTTEKLLQALQKTGSYAAAANLDLKQTVALITALSGSTGVSGQQLGTAMKSLLAYTTKGKALDMYAALSPDMANVVGEYRKGAASIIDVWRQLSTELKNISAEQRELLANYLTTEDGKSLNDELAASIGEEMEDLQDSLTGVYDTAGTYRKNYFIALMNNFDMVETALTNIAETEGYSIKENEQYLASYTAKVRELDAQWKKLANDEQGWLSFKKGLVDVASAFLKMIEYTGGLRTAVLSLASVVTLLFGKTIIAKGAQAVDFLKSAVSLTKNWTRVTELQTVASNLSKIAEEKRAIALAKETASEETLAAAVAADTAAKEANTAATEAATAAASVYAAIVIAVVAAVSAVSGIVKKQKQEQEDLRKKTIDLWKEQEESGKQLVQLNKTIETAKKGTVEFANAEKELAEKLQISREEVEKNTGAYDGYIQKIKEASAEEYKLLLASSSSAATNAKLEANKINPTIGKTNEVGEAGLSGSWDIVDAYLKVGNKQGWDGSGVYELAGNNAFERYANAVGFLNEIYDRKGGYDSVFSPKVLAAKNQLEEQIKEYLRFAAQSSIYKTLLSGGSISNADQAAVDLFNELGLSNDIARYWKSYVKDVITQYTIPSSAATSSEISATPGGSIQTSQEEQQKDEWYKDALSYLKELRDAANTIADIEKKRKELEDAERNLTTRVYDAATGRFVPTANRKNVEKARDALNDALEKAAESDIYSSIGNGVFTVSSLVGILDKYREMGVEQAPEWYVSLKRQLGNVFDKFGVWNNPAPFIYSDPYNEYAPVHPGSPLGDGDLGSKKTTNIYINGLELAGASEETKNRVEEDILALLGETSRLTY